MPSPQFTITPSAKIPGLLLIKINIFPDDRGSFREAWQQEKLKAAGLPDFQPVQWNISRSKKGVIRGVHAEPWNKLIHPVVGTVFAALVDLRPGENFGAVQTYEEDEASAIYVPKGVGNSFQATSDDLAYGYLVDGVWQAGLKYPAVNPLDPTLNIPWPIKDYIISEKDKSAPGL